MLYDEIGKTYTTTRRPDPRIAAVIWRTLETSSRILNVGAGAGAYEPTAGWTVAVEPSLEMIRQRTASMSPVVRAVAEALPFRDGAFDAALAILTLHHWMDWRRGIDEMRRVAAKLVIFVFEPLQMGDFWLTDVYFPEIVTHDRSHCPPVRQIAEYLGDCEEQRLLVPHDCSDGFLAAFWRRPEAYLDATVRSGISAFANLDPAVVARGVARLERDLQSGAWERRFGHLRDIDELDICYRLLVAARASPFSAAVLGQDR